MLCILGNVSSSILITFILNYLFLYCQLQVSLDPWQLPGQMYVGFLAMLLKWFVFFLRLRKRDWLKVTQLVCVQGESRTHGLLFCSLMPNHYTKLAPNAYFKYNRLNYSTFSIIKQCNVKAYATTLLCLSWFLFSTISASGIRNIPQLFLILSL